MSWAELFERGEAAGVTLEQVRETLRERRADE